MFPLSQFLADTALYLVVFTVFIVGSILWKPRLWLHDLPADIQKLAGPKTETEKRQTRWLALSLVPLMIVFPVVLGVRAEDATGAEFSFFTAWLYGFGLFFLMNLWDLVVIDFGGFALIDPQRPPIAGTEGAAGWKDYMFHVYGFFKGTAMSVAFGLIFALALAVLP